MNTPVKRERLRTLLRIYVADTTEAFEMLSPWQYVSAVPSDQLDSVIERVRARFDIQPAAKMADTSIRRAIRNRAFDARQEKPVPVRKLRRA